jgi:very-short-patch-repair endonuclease
MAEAARDFRKAPTRSEELLWQHLRGSELGVKFRRQQPIGPFVVDFFCPSLGLIVEVDGPIHDSQLERDQERQQLLETAGYTVLRVQAHHVETEISAVLAEINRVVETTPPRPLRERGLGGEG